MSKTFLLILNFFFLSCLNAHAAMIQVGPQVLTSIHIQGKITDKLVAFLDLGLRGGVASANINQSVALIRPALGYQIGPETFLWVGVTRVDDLKIESGTEDRIFEDAQSKIDFGSFELGGRLRVEERFMQNQKDIAVRIRALIETAIPIDTSRGFEILAQNELFWNANSAGWGPSAGFGEDQIFVGFNEALTSYFNLKMGYLLQLAAGKDFTMTHNIVASINILLPN